MDISIKILILGPLIRSIICYYNLLLVGKPSMTGMILTFPGMQPRGNETKTSVCMSTNTSVTVRARVSTLHTAVQWTTPYHYGWCSQFDYVYRQGSRWHSSWCKNSSLLFTPFSTTTHHAAAWTCTAAPGWLLWLEPLAGKGVRETTLDTAFSFGFGAT